MKPHSIMCVQYHKGDESILLTVPSIAITAQKEKFNFHYIIPEHINFQLLYTVYCSEMTSPFLPAQFCASHKIIMT